jgi:hypothetical protein
MTVRVVELSGRSTPSGRRIAARRTTASEDGKSGVSFAGSMIPRFFFWYVLHRNKVLPVGRRPASTTRSMISVRRTPPGGSHPAPRLERRE